MNKEFKKNFFICLLAVLLVISNLFCKKLTSIMDIIVGVEFITYPFTFLCTLLIMNLGNKKEAYRSILSASVIQLLITISYTIAINLGSQNLLPDQGLYINQVFKVDEFNILTSVLSFILSHCFLIYIYDKFRNNNKELDGTLLGLIGAVILNTIIYLIITLNGNDYKFIITMILNNMIIDIIMILIITIIFYILKEPKLEEAIIKEEKIDIKDLSIEEVINKKNKTKVNKSKPNSKSNIKKTSTRNSNIRKNTNTKNDLKSGEYKKKTSKKNVNKENK